MTAALRAFIREFRYLGSAAPVLSGIDLAMEPGEFVIVTGPAGGGKTTLCFCLTGVIPKSVTGHFDGQVSIAGQDLAELPLARIGPLIGLVMQAPENQLFNVTVAEDVAFGPENLQLPPAEVRARVRRSLEFTGSAHLANRFSHLLSGGQSQRIVLSSVLALEASVYVFDQPAAELDPAGRRRIYDNIARLNREAGKTIVLVEDRLSDVVQFASRILLLDGGRILRDAPPASFFADREPQAHGVRAPAAVELYHALADQGLRLPSLPLSAAEAVSAIQAALPEVSSAEGAAAPLPGVTAQPAAEPALETTSLRHRYPAGAEALAGIDLTIRRGEFVALVGENGAGKTTLAKHLVGLLRPTHGAVRVLGQDVRGLPVHRIAQWVGYLFQDPDLQIFNDNCLAEVAYGLKLRRLPQAQIEAQARAALEQVGLAELAEAHPYTLSRGQRQRLAVASVLALQPPILVVDEPSTGLDYREMQAMLALLQAYHRAGGTLLIITHDMEIATRYAQRLLVLAHGRLLHDVPTSAAPSAFGALGDAAVLLPELALITGPLGVPPDIGDAAVAARWLIGAGPGRKEAGLS
jgi:energy-coupling factor transporter ATP-binding protein EcfA2